jgi:type II secretory pathway component GspD/PulD (secretin)
VRLFIVICSALLLASITFAEAPPAEAAPVEAPPPPAEAAPVEAPPPPAEAAPVEVPPPAASLQDITQVQIQVLISETNEQGARKIGANLNYTRFVRGEEQSGSVQQITTNVYNPISDFSGVTVPSPDQGLYNPPLRPDENSTLDDGVQSREGLGLTASVISPGYGTIESTFRTVERTSDVDLVSKPEIIVVNGGLATIKAGGEVPYQSIAYDNTGNSQLSITFEAVGANLVIQPTVLSNDMVQLHLQQLEVSEVARIDNLRGIDLPVFSKRSQTGFVTVPNGQTLVVGGLTSRVIRNTERRVPVVGSIPILGAPFRSRNSEANFTHLLIFVTPTVVNLRDMTDQASGALHFWRERGSEFKNTDSIEREIAAMAER